MTLSLFDVNKVPLKIDKPVRLIELFAGIGSQAKALQRLGVDFEHYRVCEFDKYAIASYNAIHGTNFEKSDITQITASDLGVVDTDKYCYILTYSFPCQDLSLAGKKKGMAKGENTRSGLLWQVERLLNECKELPQVLLMENVTQVHGKKNIDHFNKWIDFLESKGYSNYWQDLNAKNYGIPQNRDRTFMVSVLGDYTYEFPKAFPLKLRFKDVAETNVDEKFYISGDVLEFISNQESKADVCQQVGVLTGGKWNKMHDVSRRVYSGNGIAPTLHTCGGGNTEPKIVEDFYKNRDVRIYEGVSPTLRSGRVGLKVVEPLAYDEQNGYIRKCGTVGTLTTDGSSPKHNNRIIEGKRVRKITPLECFRLMGFDDEDFYKAAKLNSNTQLYKQTGNSIVVDVLYYIFKEMF